MLFGCIAACAVLASVQPFSWFRTIVLSSIPSGYEERFTPLVYVKMVLGLRLMGALLGVAAVVLALFRNRLSESLSVVWCDVVAVPREFAKAITRERNGIVHLGALAAIFIWAICLRLQFINEPIRKDEAWTFLAYASRPLVLGITYYTANNHLLNTLLMHLSTSVFGESVWALRLPTLMAGVLLVPVTYTAIRLYHGKIAAMLTAALVCASSPLIEYSFNARGYSLSALFFTAMIALAGVSTRLGMAGGWVLLPVSAALAIYSVPTTIYGVCGVFLYLILATRDWRRVIYAGGQTGVLTMALYTPVLATVGVSAIISNQWVAPVSRNLWLPLFATEAHRLWNYWNMDLPVAVGIILAVGCVGLLFQKGSLSAPLAIVLCVMTVSCIALPLQRVVPPRRTWLFLLPMVLGFCASGLSTLIRNRRAPDWVPAILSLALAAWMGATVLTRRSLLWNGTESVGGRSAEAVVIGMKEHLSHGDQFVCSDYFDSSLDYYLRLHKIPYRPSPSGHLLIVSPPGKGPERTLELAGISRGEVGTIREAAHYEEAEVYVCERGPSLAFNPRGSTDMGVFTSR